MLLKLFEIINRKVLKRLDLVALNPKQFQDELLFEILNSNKNCEYGRKYEFNKINSLKEFQEKVPIIKYEDLQEKIERMKNGENNILTSKKIEFFATTSGSTSTPKFIPITKERLKLFKSEYTLWAIFALRNHPQMLKGRSLLLVGSNFDGNTKAEIPFGSISGYLAKHLPWYVRKKLVVPFDIYNIKDFSEKIHKIAKLGLENNISQLGLSSPIEVLLLLDYIRKHKDKIIKEIYDNGNQKRARELEGLSNFAPKNYWPNLTLLNYIKGGFAQFYLDRVKEKVESNVAIRDPGIYSSEGRISICLSDEGARSVIAVDSAFFEFIEIKNGDLGDIYTIEGLELNKKYSVLLTTKEGLYRYDLGDIIKVVDFYKRLPIIEFVDRREKGISMVGEHITESELIKSVKEASKKLNIVLIGFITIPNIENEKPRYEFLIEAKKILGKDEAKKLLTEIEFELQKNNFVYKKMRMDYGRIDFPLLSIVKEGTFDDLDTKRIQETGVKQMKPINLSNDPNFKIGIDIEYSCSV